jgi:hypothetical protein
LYSDASGLSLEQQLAAAYERNVVSGLVEKTVPESLASVAAAAVAEAQATAPETPPPTANLDPTFQSVAETALDSTATLLERIGITTPTLAEFAGSGDVAFGLLSRGYEAMQGLNLEPQLVFAPVLAPEQWADLYKHLQDDPSVNHDGRIKNGGLYIDDSIRSNWEGLQPSEDDTVEINGLSWQILVLPGTNKPPQVNIDHNGHDENGLNSALTEQATDTGVSADELTEDKMHPSMAAYLTAQASKLQSGESPLDNATYTWLSGTFQDASQAPGGCWGPGGGQVYLGWGDVGFRVDRRGVRLPVWG